MARIALVAGAAVDVGLLCGAVLALDALPSVGTVLGVVTAGSWLAAAVAGVRSTAVALDVARPYARTHGLAALGLALLWATDPTTVHVGLAAAAATLGAVAGILAGRRLPPGPWTWDTLQQASGAELEGLLRRRSGPEPAHLVGRRYRALSLGPLRGPRTPPTAYRAFFHAPRGPAVEGCERAAVVAAGAWSMAVDPGDGPTPGWFVVEAGPGTTRLNWARSRRNPAADRRRGLIEDFVCVTPGDVGLLLGRRARRILGLHVPLGWFVLQAAGRHDADGSRPRNGPW